MPWTTWTACCGSTRPNSSCAHAKLGDAQGEPVTLGNEDEEPTHDEVLINLGAGIPGFFSRFERVSEIVLATQRAEGREQYRRYREGGYPLFHHELDNWE